MRFEKGKSIFSVQPDAAISQANPVSTTWYTVLDATMAILDRITCFITWAVTQPTPLEVRVTIDGVVYVGAVANPISGSVYEIRRLSYDATGLVIIATSTSYPNLDLSGRSVKVEVRITWAITQPTPLVCRVQWRQLI